MSISEKIKSTNNKIKQNKTHYNLDKQTTKISALSLRSFTEYEFLTGKDILSEKDLLEKAAAIKRFEYSPLGKAFEKWTNFIKKQIEVINKKNYKRNKLQKTIIGTDQKYRDNVRNALLYLPKKQVEKYVEIDKRIKPADLIYDKHSFNRYGKIISFISNFFYKSYWYW